MEYRVCWRSKITGYEGHGSYIKTTIEDIRETIKDLNTECPELDHWYEERGPWKE